MPTLAPDLTNDAHITDGAAATQTDLAASSRLDLQFEFTGGDESAPDLLGGLGAAMDFGFAKEEVEVAPRLDLRRRDLIFSDKESFGFQPGDLRRFHDELSEIPDSEEAKYRILTGIYLADVFQLPMEADDEDYEALKEAYSKEVYGLTSLPSKELYLKIGDEIDSSKKQIPASAQAALRALPPQVTLLHRQPEPYYNPFQDDVASGPPAFILSPLEVAERAAAENAPPTAVASAVRRHLKAMETWAKSKGGERYWHGIRKLDTDSTIVLDRLRVAAQQEVIQQMLPDPAARQEFALLLGVQLEEGRLVSAEMPPRYSGVMSRLTRVLDDPAFQMPKRRYPVGAIKVGETVLADFSSRKATDGRLDVQIRYEGGADIIRMPEPTDAEVAAEIQRSQREAVAARKTADETREMEKSPWFHLGSGTSDEVVSYSTLNAQSTIEHELDKAEKAEARVRALQTEGRAYLIGERVREELKKPEWKDKIGDHAGWTEITKGLALVTLDTGAAVGRVVGTENLPNPLGGVLNSWFDIPMEQPTMEQLAQARDAMDTAFPGSTRPRLEGGILNDAMLKAQSGIGYMLPGLVSGGFTTLGVRQLATPAFVARYAAGRLGIMGVSNGVAAAGQSYLRTESLIHAAEAAGEMERAESIRKYRDVHALLTAGLSMASERFSPAQNLVPGRGSLLVEAFEGPVNNAIQGIVVDPLIGEHPNIAAELPSDLLSGVATSGLMKAGAAGIGLVSKTPKTADGADGGDMSLRFSAGHSGDSEALSVHKRLSAPEDSFLFGKTKPATKSMEELAVAYSRPDKTLEILDVTPYQGGKSFRIATINGEVKIIVFDKSKQVLVDTSMADSNASKSGGGAQIYQLAETFALNNGFTFRADDRVSEVAQKRRISHMASSALRHGTTRHLDALYSYYDPVTKSKKVDVPGWKVGDDDHNLALLLRREHEYVMAEATVRGIDISHLTHDPATDNIVDGKTGRPIDRRAFESLVGEFKSGDSGVGATTLLRAIVTGSALRGHSSDGGLRPLHSEQAGQPGGEGTGVSDRDLVSVARHLYYSRPSQGSGGVSARRMAESVSERPGGLAATVAEATRFLNRALPGLIHDKTHIFHSTEELLNSDYARQRGYTDEQRAQIQGAEGFFDPQTKDTIIIAGNIVLRDGETPRQAFSRVTLHERVGHDGLDYLLGSNTRFATRWTSFLKQLQSEKRTELDAIAAEKDYRHLAGKDDQLALEWFARQVENNPALLESPGKIREAWQAMRELVIDLFPSIGLKLNKGRAFDDQVHDLMSRARRAALKGKNKPNQEGGSLIRSTADAESGTEPDAESPHPQPTFDTATVRTRLEETPDTAELQELGALFVKMAARPDVFSLGLAPEHLDPAQNRTLTDSLKLFSVPAKLRFWTDPGSKKGEKLPRYELNGGESLGIIKVRENAKGGIVIDTSKVKSSALSTRAYQAIYTWALHNGKVAIPDEQYLPDGIYRRVSQMHSSALRHGTTRHMEPHEEAKALHKHWRYANTPEEQAEVDMHNIGLLAWQEALLVLELQPNLGNYGYNPATDHLYAASPHGNDLPQGRTDATAEGIEGFLDRKGSEAAQRVGPATAARTLLLNDWLAQHDAGSGDRMVGTVSNQRAPVPMLYSIPGGKDRPRSPRQGK